MGLAVDPHFGQKGIATELYKQNLMLLKKKGFKGGVAETASNFSQRAAAKNGFKAFKEVDYQSYVTEQGEHLSRQFSRHIQLSRSGKPVLTRCRSVLLQTSQT